MAYPSGIKFWHNYTLTKEANTEADRILQETAEFLPRPFLRLFEIIGCNFSLGSEKEDLFGVGADFDLMDKMIRFYGVKHYKIDPRIIYDFAVEETTHKIDNYFKFTSRPEWIAAVNDESDELPSKVMLAFERIYNIRGKGKDIVSKAMLHSRNYRNDITFEWLPDVLRTEKMLQQVKGHDAFLVEARKVNNGYFGPRDLKIAIAKLVADGESGHLTQNTDFAREFAATNNAFLNAEYPFTAKDIEETMRAAFPKTYPLAKEFEATIDAEPLIHYSKKGEKEKVHTILKDGTSARGLKLAVGKLPAGEGGPTTVALRNMLDATLKIYEMAAGVVEVDGNSARAFASIAEPAAVINDIELLTRAAKGEKYELAAVLRDAKKGGRT